MFWHVYKKEILDAIRDRKTILLSIVIPIVMMAAMVLVYENVLLAPKVEIYKVAVTTELDEQSVLWIDSLDGIDVVRAADPEQAVRDGKAVAALWADQHFYQHVLEGGSAAIKVMADQGSMKGSDAVRTLEYELELFQRTVAENRLSEAGMDPAVMSSLEIVLVPLGEKDSSSLFMASLLLPLLVTMSVMIGSQSSAVELFAGEKERKTMEALLMTPASRGQLILAKFATIATIGFISGIFAIVGFVVIVSTLTERMKEVLNFGSQLGNLIAAALLCILIFSMLMSAIQIIFSLFANNFKEAQSYFGPVMFIAMAPYFFLLGVGVNELGAIHFLIPVMNMFALLKELVYGIFSLSNLLMTLGSSAALVAVMYVIAAIMFKKDKWVLGK